LDEYETGVKSQVSPTMTGVEAAKLNTHIQAGKVAIVHAAADAAIRKAADPEAVAADFASRWPEYIKPEENKQIANAAKVQNRTNLLEQKQLEIAQRQQNEHAASDKLNKVIGDNIKFDPVSGKAAINPGSLQQALDVIRMPNAKRGDVESVIHFIESQQKEKKEQVTDDPATTKDLHDRMFLPEGQTSEIDILKAAADDKLSSHTTMKLHALQKAVSENALSGPQWRDVMDSVKGELGTDPIGHGKFGQFSNEFIPEYVKQKRAGTLPLNALDTRDPKSMISLAMAPYRRSGMQMLMDKASHGMLPGVEWSPSTAAPNRVLAPPTKVMTPADAAKLNPGTRYVTPDGKIYVR
jgi:hypothetical protein